MIHRIVRIGVLLTACFYLAACGDASGTAAHASSSGSQGNNGYDTNSTGVVRLGVPATNSIVGLKTTLTVPPPPPATGTLFLWPGLQPGGSNFAPIDNGVLQPVLTWGPSCAPGTLGNDHSSWWVSAEYVNLGNAPGYTGCQGGDRIAVQPGDQLDIAMTLDGTTWSQTVTTPAGSVSFSKDLQGQSQNFAYFVIEEDGQKPVSDVQFTNTTITFALPQPGACQPQQIGNQDTLSQGVSNDTQTSCSFDTITLRPDSFTASN